MAKLKRDGLADRTIANHIARIVSLLKANGVANPLTRSDTQKYDEKEVRVYNPAERRRLLEAASAEEDVLLRFFLNSGFREQEVMFCTWPISTSDRRRSVFAPSPN